MLNAADGTSALLTNEDGVKEPNWLGSDDQDGDNRSNSEHDILVLSTGSNGTTNFIVGDVRRFEER